MVPFMNPLPLLEAETDTNTHTSAAVAVRVDDIVHIYCYDGWTDEEFDALVQHHGLWDTPAERWTYAVVQPPFAPTIEYWMVDVSS